ncbi:MULTISPECIES: DUF1127 domain-containing protein [unclassified Sinorhizobium]|uniref:DUF1127 domain-containing protein n=1 Tax=unclassified Sinorhizobium TaxID=2613772 RepID=UPI0035264C9F
MKSSPWLLRNITRSFGRIKRARRARSGASALIAFDDRMLSDLGIGRGDAEYIARHGRILPHR